MNIVKTHKNGGKLIGNFRAKKLFSIIIAYSLEKFKIVWYNYKSEERESSSPIVYAFVAQLDRALASDARCRRFESCQAHQGIHAITWVLFLLKVIGEAVDTSTAQFLCGDALGRRHAERVRCHITEHYRLWAITDGFFMLACLKCRSSPVISHRRRTRFHVMKPCGAPVFFSNHFHRVDLNSTWWIYTAHPSSGQSHQSSW